MPYASHPKSPYRPVFVTNLDTRETKQVTDGLADTTCRVWDAGGKYLWFLAPIGFGSRSQRLGMTSYDHVETFELYTAVLRVASRQ